MNRSMDYEKLTFVFFTAVVIFILYITLGCILKAILGKKLLGPPRSDLDGLLHGIFIMGWPIMIPVLWLEKRKHTK